MLPELPPPRALLFLLLALLPGLHVSAVCPSVCSCSRSHREVDCSWRGLRQLPNGLQHNILSLNVSHNRFHNLDGQLTAYTHLRFLDLSHNRLSHLPVGLPRSLWHLYAAFNRLQLLDKNDTVYQWNLRTLDLSGNKLERAIFINNTLINLCTLNLSRNHFWTLPTNLPAHLEVIDLSHNLLVKVLPGSLDRLHRLTYFYLHANRFSSLPVGVLDRLASLRVVTLDNNPWACHLQEETSYLISWTQHTPARVLGCPCHTQPVCGGVRLGRTGGWHFASYNLPPLAASAQDLSSVPPHVVGVTGWWYLSSLLSTPHTPTESGGPSLFTSHHLTSNQFQEHTLHTEALPDDSLHATSSSKTAQTLSTDHFFTTESTSIQTKKTTTLRTRSVRRHNQAVPDGVSSNSPIPATSSSIPLLYFLGCLSVILQQVL